MRGQGWSPLSLRGPVSKAFSDTGLKKDDAMPAKKKTTEQVSIDRHKRLCGICKHPKRAKIETMFEEGYSPYEIADKIKNVKVNQVYRHVHAFNLDDKRLLGTLKNVRIIIDRARLHNREITNAMLLKALEIEAKASGELIDKFEGQIDLQISMDKQLQEIVKRMLTRLGFPEDKIDEVMAQQITEEADG